MNTVCLCVNIDEKSSLYRLCDLQESSDELLEGSSTQALPEVTYTHDSGLALHAGPSMANEQNRSIWGRNLSCVIFATNATQSQD